MAGAFTFKLHEENIGKLYFDLPGEKVNLFNEQVFDDLEKILEQLENESLNALLIFSAKPETFIAGADVRAFQAINTYQMGWQAARRGQLLFQRLHQLPFPTIAVINGACMGGGTEMSLACTYRLATDHERTKIGLPEVKLGILPGWGGTQRLPKTIALTDALQIILNGNPVNSQKALRIGLVDRIISHHQMEEEALHFAREIGRQKGKHHRPGSRSFWEKTAPGRRLLFYLAKKRVLQQTKGFYPAPLKAIEVIRQTWNLPLEHGLEIEAGALAELIITEQSKNLVGLFVWGDELKKELKQHMAVSGDGLKRKIGLIGLAPELNAFWVTLLQKNYELHILTQKAEEQKLFRSAIEKELQKLIEKHKLTEDRRPELLQRIRTLSLKENANELDLLLVNEVQQDQWKKIKKQIPEHLPVVMNSCALFNEKQLSSQKNDFVLLNLFHWQKSSYAAELITSKKELPESMGRVVHLLLNLNKIPVLTQGSYWGVVNWLLLICLSESVQLLKEGFSTGQIDQAMKNFGWQYGPFELSRKFGSERLANLLKQILKSRQKSELTALFNFRALLNFLEKAPPGNPAKAKLNRKSQKEIQDRLNFLLINWAAYFWQAGWISGSREINFLSVAALGFPPFKGGLLKYADSIGLKELSAQLQWLEQKAGLRFKAVRNLPQIVKEKEQ